MEHIMAKLEPPKLQKGRLEVTRKDRNLLFTFGSLNKEAIIFPSTRHTQKFTF